MDNLNAQIVEALSLLNPEDETHWTSDGAPRVEVIRQLVGNVDLQRVQIIQAAPDFTRATAAKASASVNQEPEVTAPLLDAEAQVQAHLDRQAELDKAMEALRLEANEKTRQISVLQAEHDEITVKLTKDGGASHLQNQRNIMEFLNAQARQREQRAAQRSAAVKVLQGQALDPRSPIDQSFARKNDRGRQRPTVLSQQQKADGAT